MEEWVRGAEGGVRRGRERLDIPILHRSMQVAYAAMQQNRAEVLHFDLRKRSLSANPMNMLIS